MSNQVYVYFSSDTEMPFLSLQEFSSSFRINEDDFISISFVAFYNPLKMCMTIYVRVLHILNPFQNSFYCYDLVLSQRTIAK